MFAIEFTVPVWTALIALVLLNEPLNVRRILALVLGFAAVLVIEIWLYISSRIVELLEASHVGMTQALVVKKDLSLRSC